jgi:hypothetical protein
MAEEYLIKQLQKIKSYSDSERKVSKTEERVNV